MVKEFIDRVPGIGYTNRKKITYEDGKTVYAVVENADQPIVGGTPINRATMMALQGFQTQTITVDNNEAIICTNANGHTLTTTFEDDIENGIQKIVEVLDGEIPITKTTTIQNGEIKVVIS